MRQAQITDDCYGSTATTAALSPGIQGSRLKEHSVLLPQTIKLLTIVLTNKILHFYLGLVPYLNM